MLADEYERGYAHGLRDAELARVQLEDCRRVLSERRGLARRGHAGVDWLDVVTGSLAVVLVTVALAMVAMMAWGVSDVR